MGKENYTLKEYLERQDKNGKETIEQFLGLILVIAFICLMAFSIAYVSGAMPETIVKECYTLSRGA